MPNVPSRPLPPPLLLGEAGELKLPSTLKHNGGMGVTLKFKGGEVITLKGKGGEVVTLKHNGGMLCNSPASLFEGGRGYGGGRRTRHLAAL